jgi:hypothetical protein
LGVCVPDLLNQLLGGIVKLGGCGEAAPDFLSIFTLPDGRTVSIMVLEQAIPVDQQRQIDACRQALVEGMSRSSAESRAAFEAALEPRGYLYGHNEFGTRFFIDISGSPLLEE